MKLKGIITFSISVIISFLISLIVILFIASNILSNHKSEIENKISNYLGVKIDSEDIDISFMGFKLAVKLENINVSNPKTKEKIFYAYEARARLNLLKSLLAREIVITDILIDRFNGSINLNLLGKFDIDIDNNSKDLHYFNYLDSIIIKNSNIDFIYADKIKSKVRNLNLNLRLISDERFKLGGNFHLDDSLNPINIKAVYKGEPSNYVNSMISIDLQAERVDLTKITNLFDNLELKKGYIKDLKLHSEVTNMSLDKLVLSGVLDEILHKKFKINTANLNLKLRKSNQVSLAVSDLNLGIKEVFKGNIKIKQILSDANLQYTEDLKELVSDNIRVNIDKNTIYANLKLLKQKDKDLVFSLDSSFADISIKSLKQFIPDVLIDDVGEWLHESLDEGSLTNGNLIFSDKGFLWSANLSDVDLRFNPDWPKLDKINGIVKINDNRIEVTASNAETKDIKIESVSAVMEDLLDNKSPLLIKGKLTSNLEQGLNYLKETPLKQNIAEPLAELKLNGNMNLDLNLNLDFSQENEDVVVTPNGYISVSNANLINKEYGVKVNDLYGSFLFTDKMFKGDDLKFNLLGSNAKGSVYYNEEDKKTKDNIIITANSKLMLENFIDKSNSFANIINGGTSYSAKLIVPNSSKLNSYSRLVVTSNLKGINIQVPKPFTKNRLEDMPTKLTAKLNDNIELNINVKDTLDGTFLLFNKSLQKGFLLFGKQQKSQLPKSKELLISGELESLNVKSWKSFIDNFDFKNSNLPVSINILSEKLNVYDNVFNSVWLKYKLGSKDIELDGPKIKGYIELISEKNDLLKLNFDYLYLDTKRSNNNFKFEDKIPKVNFSAKKLVVNSIELGDFSFNLVEKNNGYSIYDIVAFDNSYEFKGNCFWSLKNNETVFKGKAKLKNIGNLLERAGRHSTMRKGKGDINLDLNWVNSPFNFSINDTLGVINFKLKGGSILGVDPGIGKVLGLLSIESIQRRLKLDFTDVLSSGFAFDDFKGILNFEDKSINIEDVLIEGPSAKIELFGDATKERELDLNMQVTPKVGSGIPVAAAIAAGNPAIGAAVWLFDKALGSKITNVVQHQYKVLGTWDNPTIKPLGEIILESNKEKLEKN